MKTASERKVGSENSGITLKQIDENMGYAEKGGRKFVIVDNYVTTEIQQQLLKAGYSISYVTLPMGEEALKISW